MVTGSSQLSVESSHQVAGENQSFPPARVLSSRSFEYRYQKLVQEGDFSRTPVYLLESVATSTLWPKNRWIV